ncbi:MAG TPA: glycosyltransferase family 2 protein [Bryobacteraceae bacterium]|nr:glycosyltransferase family 2 protein [Bryobacteraceae bacterium]
MQSTPLLSIGMPVYNGEQFLTKALDSLLGQTFQDFEFIISDNASTDATEIICRSYAERDTRIRYSRNGENMGAGWNTRRVCSLATGKYFKWAAHDDFCERTFLEKCIEALEADPLLVLAHSKVRVIDENGSFVEDYEWPMRTDATDAVVRFRDLLLNDHLCFQLFGVVRLDALKQLPPQGSYVNSDGVLLAQLGLLGRYYEIPERLFINTRHSGQSSKTVPTRVKHNGFRLTRRYGTLPSPEWWDPKLTKKLMFPEWRQLTEYTASVHHAPLHLADKIRAYPLMLLWIKKHFRRMMKDVLIAADQVLYNWQNRTAIRKQDRLAETARNGPRA